MESASAPRRSKRQRQNAGSSAATDEAFVPPAAVKTGKGTTMSEVATVKSTPQSTPKRTPARSTKKDPWSEEQLTTSSKSRLIDADLVKLFSDPAAWVVLDDDEKADLLSLLPDQVAKAPEVSGENSEAVVESTVSAIPSAEFLRYSNDWRDALRQYQNDLSTGRYDPEWQRQAAVAMEERAQGKFDNFKEEQFEEYWGQKAQFDTSNDTEKEWGYERSAQIKMPKLIKDEVFKVGDVWKFTRLFEKEKIVIEKEARIAEIPKITSMNFVVPDGQRASFAVVDVADDAKEEAKGDAADDKAEVKEADADVMDVEVAVNDVTGPNMLALKILAIDGRMKSSSPGNVWTCFRAFRDGQDLGTLSEIRQAWFDKQNF